MTTTKKGDPTSSCHSTMNWKFHEKMSSFQKGKRRRRKKRGEKWNLRGGRDQILKIPLWIYYYSTKESFNLRPWALGGSLACVGCCFEKGQIMWIMIRRLYLLSPSFTGEKFTNYIEIEKSLRVKMRLWNEISGLLPLGSLAQRKFLELHSRIHSSQLSTRRHFIQTALQRAFRV